MFAIVRGPFTASSFAICVFAPARRRFCVAANTGAVGLPVQNGALSPIAAGRGAVAAGAVDCSGWAQVGQRLGLAYQLGGREPLSALQEMVYERIQSLAVEPGALLRLTDEIANFQKTPWPIVAGPGSDVVSAGDAHEAR